jgi:hypothetical protein
MDELIIGEKAYIPSKKAAEITGYAKDYVGQLCREGRVEAKLVGRSWYVLESSIREHRFGGADIAAPKEEERGAEAVPEQSSDDAWGKPVYIPEKIEEIVPVYKPTSVENKPFIEESLESAKSVTDIQRSWERWFSEPAARQSKEPEAEVYAEPTENDFEIPEETYVVPEEAPEENIEPIEPVREVEAPVAVSIRRTHASSTHMRETEEREDSRSRHHVSMSRMRPRKQQKFHSGRKGSVLLIKALSIAVIVLTVAVTVVGSGFLENDSLYGNQFASPIVDFIGGVEKASKY